jgi:long-subunit fatty acid transport protein
MSIFKKYIIVAICLIVSAKVSGQSARSPFTTFGIGESYSNALVNNQGMAGVGVSQPQYFYLNNQNPALLIYNTFTVFEAGVFAERRTIRDANTSTKSSGGNMNYLATAFPIKPGRWTTSLGLAPFTRVNYKIKYQDDVQNSTEKVNVTEEGSGGITQLYWSNGVKLSKELAVGLKASYLFSSIVNTYKGQLVNPPDPSAPNYIGAIENKAYVKDFAFTVGVAFNRDSIFSSNKYRFSAGLVYDFAANLKTHKTDKLFRTTIGGDTIESAILPTSGRGRMYIPAAITGGVSLTYGSKWTIATQFSYRDWSSFRSVYKDDQGLGKSWRAAIGGELVPDVFSVDSYLKRLTYRMGVSYEQYPYAPNGRALKDRGINFGLSLPTGRSSLDFAFKFGKRGDKKVNLIEENYFQVYFGFTFNDQWFIKRKFD